MTFRCIKFIVLLTLYYIIACIVYILCEYYFGIYQLLSGIYKYINHFRDVNNLNLFNLTLGPSVISIIF